MIKYFFLIVVSLIFYNCTNKSKKVLKAGEFFCDAETLNNKGDKFLTNGVEFGHGKYRSSEEAFGGKYSCVVEESHKTGMLFVIDSLNPNEIFDISVYRKSTDDNGVLVASTVPGGIYIKEGVSIQKKDSNGWDLLSLKLQLPADVSGIESVKIFVLGGKPKSGKIYFDNLRIHRYSRKISDSLVNKTSFNIELTDYDYKAIRECREKALKQHVITKGLKKEVNGILKYLGKTYRIGIRLKGDWTDHLEGDKWSYRISVKDGQTIMGLKTFSIQSPKVRDYLQEWVMHKICDQEGLLTTSLDYVPVVLNGMDYGVYNVEEHFEKQLVESRNRREGVILKFNEEGFWENNIFRYKSSKQPPSAYYEASIISPFNKNKTLKSGKLKAQFLIAQNLMLKYKNGDHDIENFIDIDKLAKTYALMDLGNVHHSYIWHNQRFYYNPVTSKLELILYDCYSGPGESYKRSYAIKGNTSEGVRKMNLENFGPNSVFDHPVFQKAYLKCLKKYSSENYVNEIVRDLKPVIDSLSQQIQKEESFYKYDFNFLKENSEKIRGALLEYEGKIQREKIEFVVKNSIEYFCPPNPFKHISLNVYLEGVQADGSALLSLENYYCLPITIVGYSSKQFPDSLIKIGKKLKLGGYPKDKKTYSLTTKQKPKKVFYKVENNDSIYSSKLISWPIPKSNISHQIEEKPFALKREEYIVEGDVVTFNKGRHIVKKPIVIPKGMKVVFEPGVELIFNKSTYFMSYSAVNMIGNKSDPIKVGSTDGTGNGFAVLEAKKKSKLSHVVFDGLNTFNSNGWVLTGAVTFYESEVEIDNVQFTNNNCEDGLNIVRSKFKLANSEISNTYSDGFDADFCEGIVENCSFVNTGNDCLDFSGSTVSVSNCRLTLSGDKGISCGEKSSVEIIDVVIDGAELGVASKDNSIVTITNIQLKNCKTGFAAFQKKSEYGPGYIEVNDYSLQDVGRISNIEKGSSLDLKNKKPL
jgi:hypothetical protein